MIVEQLLENARRFPHHTAVMAQGESISYEELEHVSSRIAANLVGHLLAHSQVVPQNKRSLLVGIYTTRDIHAISLMLGVLKANHAYTFIEEEGSLHEKYTKIQSLDADIIICQPQHAEALKALGIKTIIYKTLLLNDTPYTVFAAPSADDVAYVLFTSGSTGKPKGVMVTYGNLSHYCHAVNEKLEVGESLNFAHVSTLAADLGNTSLFLSLITGGCLHLLDESTRKDPIAFRDYCDRFSINFIKITPSHWRAIFSKHTPPLQYLVFGGEALPKKLAEEILDSDNVGKLFNHYGPTETTIGITVYPVQSQKQLDSIDSDTLPIGYPFGSNQLYICTEDGELHQRNATGELYVSGPSVTLGYRHDDCNTQDKFIYLSTSQPQQTLRFYKTGDLVKVNDTGCIHFLGRLDRQVKINGYRVELEQIEAVMRSLDHVDDAAVFYLERSPKNCLVAAVQANQANFSVDQIKQQMKELLPEYMIPRVMLAFDHFEVTANGKKNLKRLKDAIIEHLDQCKRESQSIDNDQLEAVIRQLFEKALDIPVKTLGGDSSFYDLGGDSLGAIQLISELQDMGHRVTALSFFKEPTINGLIKLVQSSELNKQASVPRSNQKRQYETSLFSAAQHEFFAQNLRYPDHYNQSVLLECGEEDVDIHVLHESIDQLIKDNPILSTAFFYDEEKKLTGKVKHRGCDENLSVTFISTTHEQNVQYHIETIAEEMNKSLSLKDGRLFRAHLFKSEKSQDMLLIVCHHLAVDLISWHIISSQINRNYTNILQGNSDKVVPASTTFWDWLHHLQSFKDTFQDEWLATTAGRTYDFSPVFNAGNTEGAASTLWLGFPKGETRQIQDNVSQVLKEPLHVVLLSAFLDALRSHGYHQKQVAVEIESHGRVTFDESIDISRVVGWHTSTYPLFVNLDQPTIASISQDINHQLNQVTHLGVGFGLQRAESSTSYQPSGAICFNYLGDTDFETRGELSLKPSLYSFGHCRHVDNHRGHEIKLTGKITHDCLCLDVSFSKETDNQVMQQVMQQVKNSVASLAGIERSQAILMSENGTRTGMINYAPRKLIQKLLSYEKRAYNNLFMTGVTGYIGAYALKELLESTQTILHCLVRSKDAFTAMSRLSASFNYYFPNISLSQFEHRIKVYAGDVAEPLFGLNSTVYEVLSQQVDAIYHFAADTRLLGDEADFAKTNLNSVQNCIDLALLNRRKDVHYMSTLAVSGVNKKPMVQDFSENDLDIGQEFQNHYELTKYNAETLLSNFGSRLNCFIYRTGNVSAASVSARFQKNATDNRLVQFLIACAKIGKLPVQFGEDIILSPVDIVAKGVVHISLNQACSPAVYHVDSAYQINMKRVFQSMQRNGLALSASEFQNFGQLFKAFSHTKDRDIAVGHFWVKRGGRNVRYRNEKTLALLKELNISFSPLSDEWLDRFIGNLVACMNEQQLPKQHKPLFN